MKIHAKLSALLAVSTAVCAAAIAADAPAASVPAKTATASAAIIPLALGDAAPAGTGVDQDGKAVDLGALYKKGTYVLVYFYPKAGTKGCTDEACSLRDAFDVLTKENLTVVGVSHDTVAEQKDFATKQKLPFSLVADTKGDIYTAFHVPQTAPGADAKPVYSRQSFLVKNGKIIWLDLKASTAKQADDVKKALDADKAASMPKSA